jgi:hypothetical protein
MMGDGAHAADMQVFHQLFAHRAEITRHVLDREDGVETVTESSNPEVTRLLQTHVASMLARVKEGRPIHRRDPLFAELFRYADRIDAKLELTAGGVRVVETSQDQGARGNGERVHCERPCGDDEEPSAATTLTIRPFPASIGSTCDDPTMPPGAGSCGDGCRNLPRWRDRGTDAGARRPRIWRLSLPCVLRGVPRRLRQRQRAGGGHSATEGS